MHKGKWKKKNYTMRHYLTESCTSQKTPCRLPNLDPRSLVAIGTEELAGIVLSGGGGPLATARKS
jgi:gamma-glutamyl-gamma-aminobutyrate hydrolase PuuD